jgi:hypothetical protein
VVLAVAAGLVVGGLTSVGQSHLGGALAALVNSASAWLVAPFLVGAVMRTPRGAAAAGLTTCALQLVGYYVVSDLRGFPAGGSIVLFWTVCAALGGPVFGAAGRRRRAGLAPAAMVLPAAFLAEGLWVYLHELRYYGTAALWLGIGAALTLAFRHEDPRWLALTLPVALAGEIALSAVYRQAF